jgi:hypothetical protein
MIIRLLYDVPLSLWIFLYITVMIGSNNLEFSFNAIINFFRDNIMDFNFILNLSYIF